ncbi:titin [Cocos nucifera]|uniref:Titin n=1 Tax=Cocos nucifera TaxID=13894 RepID=A0A8K0N9G4_COCNU|nr:titin [Cocos nucifera]
MSTIEHLFMQIFERKNWVEGQLRQQIDSYGQSLAYNLLADGGHPPPWLWTMEPDAPGCPDSKALKGTNVSQPNSFFNEIGASNKSFFTEPIDEVVPDNFLKDTERDSNMIGLKVVETNAEFDLLPRIRHSRLRQRDPDYHLSKKAKITSFGDENTMDQYTGRTTCSRFASLKADSIKETSVMTNLLAFDNVDGGQATRSRRASQKLDSLHKLSRPAKTLKPMEYGIKKASEDQMGCWPGMSANIDTLEGNDVDDAMAPQRCARGAAAKGLASDASRPVDSGLKMTCTAAPELSQILSLVEPRQLLSDGMEVCGSNDNPVTAFEKENQEYSEVTLSKMEAVQSLKENHFCQDFMKDHCSLACREPQDDVLHTGEVMQRTEEAGTVSEGCANKSLKLVEVDDSECHPLPSSCNKHSQAPAQLPAKPTHWISENELTHPSSMNNSILNCSTKFSGQPSVQHDCSSEGSSGDLGKHNMEEQCSVPLVDVLTSIVASRQSESNSSVEPKDHLLDAKKQINLDRNSIASLVKETKGSNSESDLKLDTVQSVKEESFHRSLKTAHVSPANVQIQDEVVLPAIEDVRSTDESKRDSVGAHEEISRLLVMVKPKCSPQFIHYDDIPSHIMVMSALEVMSGGDVSEKHSIGSPVQCPTDKNCEGMLIKETNGSSTKSTDPLLSDGLELLFSETDDICMEAERAETTAVQLGKRSFATLTSISDAAENHHVVAECQHLSRSSNISDKIIGSCKSNDSVLVSSNKVGECFSPQETVVNAGVRDIEEKLTVRKMPNTAEAPRNSSSLDKNFGSCIANAICIPCPEKISIQLENIKGYICAGAKNVIGKNVTQHLETPNNIEAQIAAPEAHYSLRSLSSHQKNLGSFRLIGTNATSSSKRSREIVAPACEISWPKRRKLEGRSDIILATSPRMRFKTLLHVHTDGDCRSKMSSDNALGDGMELQSSLSPSELKIEIANAALENPPEALQISKKLCVREDGSCLKPEERTMVAPLQTEHRQGVSFHYLAEGISGTSLAKKMGASELSDFKLKEHCFSEDNHDLMHGRSTLSPEIINSPGYHVELTEETNMNDTERSFYTYDMADCDETMPEFEGFSIGVPSPMENSVLCNSDLQSHTKAQDSVLEQLCCTRNLVTPRSCPSTKYKINRIPDVYQSLPAGTLEHMESTNLLHFNDVDIKQFRESEDDKFSGFFGNLELEYDGYGKSHSHSMPSSSSRFGWLASKPPLSPPVEKLCQRKFSARSGASSETVGSNPELVCFRINENTSTTEENENPDELDMSKERVGSRETKESTNRKALLDVTALYQNAPTVASVSEKFAERSNLQSVNAESYSGTQKGVCVTVENVCARKPKIVDKENHSLPVDGNRVQKAAESINSRFSKPEISRKPDDRNKNWPEKGCKPSNIVSNISSFIPLVQQKQQAATAKGKKEIKVKALEAAEAAKRLEEKKQNEREMRKAAARLERARLEQEKELKQKQKEDERKKKEAEVAARKRQREEEERKEKERKRRCIEEARKLQREKEEKLRAQKEERELRRKAADEKVQRKKESMEQANRQSKSEKEREIAGCKKDAELEPSTTEVVVREGIHGNNSFAGPDSSKELNDLEKSYEMSPYKDSEVEDDDAEDEIRRRRKYIPSWAR